MIFGINTARDISKLSQISHAYRLVKLRITILKYHSWYLCQISLQIILLPIRGANILAGIKGFRYLAPNKKTKLVSSCYLRGGGGGYCHIWAIQVCAAVKGMVFKQFTVG